MSGKDTVFTIPARRCKRCGGLLTSAQGLRDGYGPCCLWQIRSPPRPLAGPVNVRCLYYMPTRRRVDLTNLLEATDDILVRAGVLADDCASVVAGHDGSRVLLDRQRPRVEIVITEMG